MKLTDEDIKQMEMDARRFQGAWTGTSGTLASHVVNLIKHAAHLSERRRERSRLPRPAAAGRLFASRRISCRPPVRGVSWRCPAVGGGCNMTRWNKTSESLPKIGQEVIVITEAEVYAIASLEEDRDGDAYWDSPDDIVHGQPADYPTHWTTLPHPPR